MRCLATATRLCATLLIVFSAGLAPHRTVAEVVGTAYTIDEGHWYGGAYKDDADGQFAYCFIGSETVNGVWVGIFLYGDAGLMIAVASEGWSFRSGTTYTASLEVDSVAKRSAIGDVEQDLIAFDLGRDPVFFNALRRGNELWFVGDAGSVGIKLRPDTEAALAKMEACLRQHAGLSVDGRRENAVANPFETGQKATADPFGGGASGGAPPSAASNPFASATSAPNTGNPEDLRKLQADLRTLLASIGFPPFSMEDLSADDDAILFEWSDRTGGLVGYLALQPVESGDYRNDLMALASSIGAGCGATGQPVYDAIVTSRWGEPIYSGRVDCRKAAYSAIYFVVGVEGDVAAVFLHMASDAMAAEAQQINANLRNHFRY